MKISKIIKNVAAEFDNDKVLFGNLGNSTCFNYNVMDYYNMFSRYYANITIWQTNYIHQMNEFKRLFIIAKK